MYSNYINKCIYESLFSSDSHRLGEALVDAKNQIIGVCDSYNDAYRWLFFSINMLGDPETPIYVKRPQKLSSISSYLLKEGDNLILTPEDPFNLTVMSRADNGQSFYTTSPEYFFNENRTDLLFCVTKPGYIPYIGIYSPTVYIQDETIDKDFHVLADKVYIGSDVTSQKWDGPVKITKGSTIIDSSEEVTIKNDFEVKLGATFEIKINNQ